MPFMTTPERIGREQGCAEGRIEGIELALELTPGRVERLGAPNAPARTVDRELTDLGDPVQPVHRPEVRHVHGILRQLLPRGPDAPLEPPALDRVLGQGFGDVPEGLDAGIGVVPREQVPVPEPVRETTGGTGKFMPRQLHAEESRNEIA